MEVGGPPHSRARALRQAGAIILCKTNTPEFATGGFSLDHGNWWIEPNGHFCVRYTRFAGGNLVCRELSVEKGIVKAYTWDHRPNPWVFNK